MVSLLCALLNPRRFDHPWTFPPVVLHCRTSPAFSDMVLFTFALVYLVLRCFDHPFAWSHLFASLLCCCPWVLLCMCVHVCAVCLCSCVVKRVLCFPYSHSVLITRRLRILFHPVSSHSCCVCFLWACHYTRFCRVVWRLLVGFCSS